MGSSWNWWHKCMGLGCLFLTACHGQAPRPPSPQVETDKPVHLESARSASISQLTERPIELPKEIFLTEKHEGTTVTVYSGQRVEIRLRGNLMTGYDWKVDKVTPPLPAPDEEYQPPTDDKDGSHGTKRISWQTEGIEGTFHVRLVYRRRVASQPPPQTYEITLDIRK
jgi:predicted secreted protein